MKRNEMLQIIEMRNDMERENGGRLPVIGMTMIVAVL